MRIFLLTVVIFVLAGLATAFTKLGLTDKVATFVTGGPELAFEFFAEVEEVDDTVEIQRARPDGVLLLTRGSVAQTAHFQMPQDAGLISGVLNLKATAQISEGQQSILRVLVGNQTRGEVLLRGGFQNVDAEIGLTADDLANESLAIRYALVSPDDAGACTPNGGWSNVVEIEQDSQIVLDVQNSKLTPRDQVAAWGNVVLIGWPNWLSEEQRRARWYSAMLLSKRGFEVRFVDAPDSETLSGNQLRSLVESDVTPELIAEAEPAWPEYVAKVGGNAGKRSFQRSASWRHWYRIGPDDHMTEPGAFDYELMLGPLPDDAEWTVTITHNGSIIEAMQVPGNVGRVGGRLSLNNEEIGPSNVIEITAISGYEPTGLCNNGPVLFGELRPNTRLLGGGDAYENNMDLVIAKLNQRQPVTVTLPKKMSLVEAQRMLDLARELVPAESDVRLVAEGATMTGVRRSDYTKAFAALPSYAYVVWFDQTDRINAVEPAAYATDQLADPLGALALVVNAEDVDRLSLLGSQ